MTHPSRVPALAALITVLGGMSGLSGQLPSPPTIAKGTAPGGDVRSMSNNQNSLASLGDGSIAALIYKQTSATSGGHLTLGITVDEGKNWTFYPLPHNTAHLMHEPESGVLCAGTRCDRVHVAWSDRSADGVWHSAWYGEFDTGKRQWLANPVEIAKANPGLKQPVQVRDITATPLDTVAVAVEVGANGGLGMTGFEGALLVRRRDQPGFSQPWPMRVGPYVWSREASIVAVEEVIHCAFKNTKGGGGIAYRSFDTKAMAWQQPGEVMVGPNDNGTFPIDGINAGNKAVLARDTKGGLYILYVTGSAGGLQSNNKMRMAYAGPGTGGKNADWADLEVIPHTTTVGKNPRGVAKDHPSYPALQGGDTTYLNYTLAQGFQGSMLVVYSKPWEDFQNKYVQIWQYGVNVPLPTKEIAFWNDTEPFVFERMGGMRSTSSVGQAAWVVYGKNDKPTPGQAPNGWVRLWAATYSTGRTVSFGTGCRGRLPEIPRMHANEQFPQLGVNYYVEFERFPGSAAFFLALGTKCQTVDLTAIGAPGCELNIDFPVVVPLSVDPAGRLTLSWVIPNDNKLIGRFFYSQSFVVAPIANAAQAVTSNALWTVISQ